MNKIKEIRKRYKLNQSEFAKKFNISQQTISNWENEITNIDIESLLKISNTFNISTDYILGRTEQINNPLPTSRPDYEITEKFMQDYAELLKDKSFTETAKLYNTITPDLRALALGYIVGILQKYNIDTKKILGY